MRRILVDVAPPKLAQNFSWTRIGHDILFEVGYFDLFAMNAAIEAAKQGGTPGPVDFFITDRFALSMDSADRLIDVVEHLKEDLGRERAKPA
jgi:hypothetical protein